MERLRTKAQEYLNRLANPAGAQPQPVTSNPGPIGPGGQNLLLKQKPLEQLDQTQSQWLPPGIYHESRLKECFRRVFELSFLHTLLPVRPLLVAKMIVSKIIIIIIFYI